MFLIFLNLLMCVAIRFSRFEFSDKCLADTGLELCGDEVRVSFMRNGALLPVHYGGENQLIMWGNKVNAGVPRTGYCRVESLEAGKWQWLSPERAVVLASSALVNGVWFQVRQGIEAVLVRDARGEKHCYILTQPSTHYFKVMTGSLRMPMLVNQIL